MTFIGALCLIVLDKTVLCLAFHAQGMLKYSMFPTSALDVVVYEGIVPDDIFWEKETYVMDAHNHNLTVEYEGERVKQVKAFGTYYHPFNLASFDRDRAKKAIEKKDLPGEVQIVTDQCIIRFVGDSIEYGYVEFYAV